MKLIIVCPIYEMDGPGTKQSLEREVRRCLEKVGGTVNSASGRTAALAVNYCERLKIPYTLRMEEGMYFVVRG
jgi:hypothetical protein